MPIQPFRWSDLPAFAGIRNKDAAEAHAPLLTEAEAGEYLRQPNLKPERDLFLASEDGQPVGYALVTLESLLHHAVIEGAVVPEWRRRRIGTALMQQAIVHSRLLLATKAITSAGDGDAARQRLFASLGMLPEHHQLQLRLEPDHFREGRFDRSYTVRLADAPDVRYITRLQNRAFASGWNYCPNTPDELHYRMRMHGGEYSDTILLWVGKTLVAYCWTRPRRTAHGHAGVIWMIGVDPDWHGKGLGQAILAESVQRLRDGGAAVIDLTVNEENDSALNLYRQAGFAPVGQTVWYQLSL